MAVMAASVDISAPVGTVWGIVSDLDGEPEFWKGTKSVRNIKRGRNRVTREVTIAFRDKKCMQEVVLVPQERIEAVFTDGVIIGSRTVTLKETGSGTRLEAVWDIRMGGMLGMFTGMVKRHILSGTRQALESIGREAERRHAAGS